MTEWLINWGFAVAGLGVWLCIMLGAFGVFDGIRDRLQERQTRSFLRRWETPERDPLLPREGGHTLAERVSVAYERQGCLVLEWEEVTKLQTLLQEPVINEQSEAGEDGLGMTPVEKALLRSLLAPNEEGSLILDPDEVGELRSVLKLDGDDDW